MQDINSNISFTEEEFLCFFLIYAGHVDYEFSDEERNFILSRFDASLFERMEKLFNNYNDYTCLKIILAQRDKHFNTQEKLDKLIEMLKSIFNADGNYSRLEQNFLPFFLKMINIKT